MTDPLVHALAAMVDSVIRNHQRQTSYAITHGEPVYEPCSCHADIGPLRCVCAVELAMTNAWMRRAAEYLGRHEYVGIPTRRHCRLCRSGDHDLVATQEVKVIAAGSDAVGAVRVAAYRRRNRRHELDRATRAGAYPAGTRDEQRNRLLSSTL
jgi:hypothetical protein